MTLLSSVINLSGTSTSNQSKTTHSIVPRYLTAVEPPIFSILQYFELNFLDEIAHFRPCRASDLVQESSTGTRNTTATYYYYYYYRFTALWILSRTTRVSRYQKGKTKINLDFLEQETVSGSCRHVLQTKSQQIHNKKAHS